MIDSGGTLVRHVVIGLFAVLAAACATAGPSAPIDREALVTRHNPRVTAIDPASPFMVGNGDFAFAADITGMQTFREEYSTHSPLLTQAQWAWHSFPNPNGYTLENALRPIQAHGQTYRYPYFEDWGDVARDPALRWLRENPHRFSLSRMSLRLRRPDGSSGAFTDISETSQELDMWRGEIRSAFKYSGAPVTVVTRVAPDADAALFEVRSELVGQGLVGVSLGFPYVGAQLNPDPSEWNGPPEQHHTQELARSDRELVLERELDDTHYWVRVTTDAPVTFYREEPHFYGVVAKGGAQTLRVMIEYSPTPFSTGAPSFAATADAVTAHWRTFWSEGGAIDLSATADPRAHELERRIVLSQYLTAVNSAGDFIPQEEGLYSNSWNGKFHHEMHWWHDAHFALWGREELLARSMDWYVDTLPAARARAAHYGRRGAWWPKMTGNDARESPSTINPFIMWQQPQPIYLAELLYRADPTPATLEKYSTVVFETADLLASYPVWDEATQLYIIGPPIVPSQETYAPRTTMNPTFEIAYFQFGLTVAQHWRERMGLTRDARWDHVLAHLPPLPQREGLYVGAQSAPEVWSDAANPACGGGLGRDGSQTTPPPDASCLNRDHPSFVAALGLLPGDLADRETMRRTLDATYQHWDFRQTWGWDFPMLAMTAARLDEPDLAVNFLLLDAPNNQYGLSGMTPRFHLSASGFERNADTYLPSNGSLLAAVALMAAGWDGAERATPGFPEDWTVKTEGLRPLP